MLRVIVHVRQNGAPQGIDLEVPAELPVRDLTDIIAQALGWPQRATNTHYRLHANPPGRHLKPDETLALAGTWDGAELVLTPEQIEVSELSARPEPPAQPEERVAASEEPLAVFVSPANRIYPVWTPNVWLGRKSVGAVDAEHTIDLRTEEWGKSVSRRHAWLEYADQTWWITPLHNEQNRTLVNGEKVPAHDRHNLPDGAEVQLGGVKLVFRSTAATDKTEYMPAH